MQAAAMRAHRDTIFVEDATIIHQESWPGEQYLLRLEAPLCAAHAQPGSFAHLQCEPALPMRRPLSIMRVDAEAGWVDFLYKVVGRGTRALAARTAGEIISSLGPIGMPFVPDRLRPRTLLLGGGVGIPPMVFLADRLRGDQHWQPVVMMGSEAPFPFAAQPSRFLLPGMPEAVIASMPPGQSAGLSGLPRGIHYRPCPSLAGCADAAVTRRSRPVCLRAAPDAGGNCQAGSGIRPPLPGLAGRIHGVCRRRLRRLRGAD